MTSSPAQPLPAPPDAAAPERAPGAAVVRVRDLRMRYGDAEPVVDGVALDVGRGPGRQPDRAVGLGQEHGAPRDRGPAPAGRRHGRAHGRPARDRLPVPGRRAPALAHRPAERRARTEAARRGPGRGAEGSRRLAGAARARGVRGPLSPAALRRPAQARGARAGAGAAAEAPADGRALRRPRRDRAPPRHPGPARLGRARADRRPPRHPRPRGGAGAFRRRQPAVARPARADRAPLSGGHRAAAQPDRRPRRSELRAAPQRIWDDLSLEVDTPAVPR